jgi:hypothetical protein
MAAQDESHENVGGVLKGEMKWRDMSYPQLAERLQAMSIHETERKIANKISRGVFTVVFIVQCLVAIGCKYVSLEG